MRRFVLYFAPLVPLMLAGCEDGPAQTFAPAPGDLWNNGSSPAAVDDAGTSFTTAYGGTSKTEICSGAELQSQWARMVEQPIVPPYDMGGIDISGIDYQFLTVEQAENGINGMLMPAPGATNPPTRLCQGANLGAGGNGGDIGGSLVTAWGNNDEMTMEWAVPTHKAYFMQLNPGYLGSMDWTFTTASDNMSHTYHWQIGHELTKDGMPFQLDWNGFGTPSAQFNAEADELYRGLTSSFAPDIYDNLPAGVFCHSTGRCPYFPTGNDGVHPIIGFRTISMYWDMGSPIQPQPSGSTPHDAYLFNIKYAPYSFAVSNLKMDLQGPTGSLNPIGTVQPPLDCELSLGGTFADLKSHCIDVYTGADQNTTAEAKVLGNLTHDDQNFTFSVVGINQNYRPPQLDLGGMRQFDIIHDNEQPMGDALAVDFTLDVRANGAILNDRYPTATAGVYGTDYHGAGAVMREYGRTVQQELAAKYAAEHNTTPRALHAAECLFPMSCQGGAACTGLSVGACGGVTGCGWGYNFAPGQTVDTWRAAPGCTGFEGWVDDSFPNTFATTGLPVDVNDPTATDPDNVWSVHGTFGNISDGGLRPGSPYGLWCMDPGIYNYCGSPTLYGDSAPLLDGSYAQVVQILGNGDVNNLPSGTGDYRYYFEKFTQALAKYMESNAWKYLGQNYTATAPTGFIAAPVPYFGDFVLNTDDLFFDSYGGNANRSEFIQWENASLTQDPTDLNISMLLIGTNLQEEHFYRRLDREERALFNVMQSADSQITSPKQASWAILRDSTGNIKKDEFGQQIHNADMFITNIAGSTTIAHATNPITNAPIWLAPTDSSGAPIPVGTPTAYDPCNPTLPPAMVMKTAEYCATHLDPDCTAGLSAMAPQDANGNIITRPNGEPLLAGYCGIWNPSPLALGSANIKLIDKDVTAAQQQLEQEAEVELPIFANPYDQTTASTTLDVLVPWLPKQEGVGFGVPSSGQNDVFVETAELDFSGQVVVPVFDYLPITVTPTGADGGVTGASYQAANILAIESQDFLGDTFVCYDPVTQANRLGSGAPGDILAARMYTSVQDILTWVASHPTVQDTCQLIIRYSPYNNYPDYVTSLANGVKLGIDQGQGSGRVTDLTLFVPGSGSPAPP